MTERSRTKPCSCGRRANTVQVRATARADGPCVMTLGTATTVAVRRTREAKAIDPLRFVAAAAAHLHGWAVSEEGRRRTARVLRSLDRGTWQVRQNIRLPDGGRADHLAIGPSGVYLLDSRAWLGVVTVDHKGATITPPGRPAARLDRPGPALLARPRRGGPPPRHIYSRRPPAGSTCRRRDLGSVPRGPRRQRCDHLRLRRPARRLDVRAAMSSGHRGGPRRARAPRPGPLLQLSHPHLPRRGARGTAGLLVRRRGGVRPGAWERRLSLFTFLLLTGRYIIDGPALLRIIAGHGLHAGTSSPSRAGRRPWQPSCS